jgi:hypothetical protein
MPTNTFWNLDSVQQSRIPAGNVTQKFSTQQGSPSQQAFAASAGAWAAADDDDDDDDDPGYLRD